jgi:hypothetical protein
MKNTSVADDKALPCIAAWRIWLTRNVPLFFKDTLSPLLKFSIKLGIVYDEINWFQVQSL